MHLLSIKISGFKSFADPVVIQVPRHLCGVVGPNGSGKSNIIDAMRWVIGESSAKSLRADTLDDVIFNGSEKRRPASQCSVELLFDNADNRCVGQWQKYAEISVRRTATRDGISEYFINGTRTRRRDVKELFLGTGLGPRSYSIIEQGMISRIVQGKPEQLSAFIEEASGVSRFREKRHETMLKMEKVEANLERLNDMRGELEKRLRQLKYQADQARRYTQQKEKLNVMRAQLLTHDWGALQSELDEVTATKSTLNVNFEKCTSEVRKVEANLAEVRKRQIALQGDLSNLQIEQYRIDGEISQCDRQIQSGKDEISKITTEIDQHKNQVIEIRQTIDEQVASESESATEIDRIDALIDDASEVLKTVQAELAEVQSDHAQLHQRNERAEQETFAMVRQREAALAAFEENERAIQSNERTCDSLQIEICDLEQLLAETKVQPKEVDQLIGECAALRTTIAEQESELTASRSEIDGYGSELDELRDSAQHLQVRLGTLEGSLPQHPVSADELPADWGGGGEEGESSELFRQVSVVDGWERAVDCVLGRKLSAICVDDISRIAKSINGHKFTSRYYFVDKNTKSSINNVPRGLAQFVSSPHGIVEGLLDGVVAVESIHDALAMRSQLTANECAVTAEGAMVGVNWFSPPVVAESASGVLEIDRQVKQLRTEVQKCEAAQEIKRQQIQDARQSIRVAESKLSEMRLTLASSSERLEQSRAELSEQQTQHLRTQEQLEQKRRYSLQLQSEIRQLQSGQVALKGDADQHQIACAKIESDRMFQQEQLKEMSNRLQTLQNAVNEAMQEKHQHELDKQSMDSKRQLAQSTLAGLRKRLAENTKVQEELSQQLTILGDPSTQYRDTLRAFTEQRQQVDVKLALARNEIEAIESEFRELDEQRLHNQMAAEDANSQLQEKNVELGRLTGVIEETRQKVVDLGIDPEHQLEQLGDAFDYDEVVNKVERLTKRIESTGAVNLIAVSQYEEETQRKLYMDDQCEDLTKALETLRETIEKIDCESRQRYGETFNKVNSEYQRLVPALFGAGSSGHLELVGEYPDNPGVLIYARPKGKLVHSIQPLSGGEKALTAVALILSLFQLNPSPVCLLDEIDAPLDDKNIDQLCSSLNELAIATQLILITHNKITMESLDTLVGVTMQEPNVSKILSVDLQTAQEFVA